MKILFITATRIGDAVLSTGILTHLLTQHPSARVTVACGAPAAGLFAGRPNIDRVLVIDKKPYGRHWLELWGNVILNRWDIVVDLRRSAIAYCLWAKNRYIAPKTNDNTHRVVDLAATLGLSSPPAPTLWIGESARENARKLISDLGSRPLLCVGPTANWGGKMWRGENFIELIRRITAPQSPYAGSRIAIFGAAHEKSQAQPVIDGLIAAGLPVTDLLGKPDLLTCAAIFSAADLYIGNDSGLMHIAAASGGNVLGLFGPSPAVNYAPWPSGNGRAAFVQTAIPFLNLVYDPSFDHRSQKSLMDSLTVDMAEHAVYQLWREIKMGKAA